MTPEEFTKNLPPYANDPARSQPPFVFNNLSARVFPLRASLAALQHMCDSYLNIVPREVGRFRAMAPYAYLALLDYGQISEKVDSIGWFAQTEVYFGVPVEWYKVVNGKWVFHDWAVITPFIYVDDDFSAPLGRSVFGFPKTMARLTKTSSEWLRDPVAAVTLARVETRVFPELYKGQRQESRVFLEVERAAPMSNFQVPPDPTSPIAPWNIASRLAEAMAGFGRDAMRISQSARVFEPSPWTHPPFGVEMLNRLMPALMPDGKGFTLNSLNLKQFRSSEFPLNICYQALTNGGMQMLAFNGAGLLGEERTAFGDLTGGYSIKLHEYSSLPIARTLGLEVHRRRRGNHVDVATILPVMPFWANLNVQYLKGENLAWRKGDGIWRGGNGSLLDPTQKRTAEGTSDSPLFNTTVASAVDDAVTGPFRFSGTTIRVLPLLAYREKLEKFLDNTYINDQLKDAISRDGTKKTFKLSLWSRPPVPVETGELNGGEYAYIYMTAASFGSVTSKTNNIGDWAKYELSFLIPVKLEYESEDGKWELQGVGLVPAYTFVDDSTAAVSRTEVLGIPTLRANFKRPASVWLQVGEVSLGERQTLLRVDAEVFTAFHVGQQASIQPLLEISSRDFSCGSSDYQWQSRVNPDEWAKTLQSELEAKQRTAKKHEGEFKIALALALELLGNRVPVTLYTLKQFRDVADPGKACYQSVVRVSRTFDEIFDIREIDETLRVRIHDFPSLPLVENLGIVANPFHQDGTGVTYETQAIRPFYIRANISEALGKRFLRRAGTPEWESGESAFEGLLGNEVQYKIDNIKNIKNCKFDSIKVDEKALEKQDQGDPCKMNRVMYASTERWQLDKSESDGVRNAKTKMRPIKKEAAREALGAIDPQMVIDAILSREWGNTNNNAKWRVGRNKALHARDLMLSSTSAAFAALELSGEPFLKGVAKALRTVPKTGKKTVRQNQTAEERDQIAEHVQKALVKGRAAFTRWEKDLYETALNPKSKRPGRRDLKKAVDPIIQRMGKFTSARLEMENHFGVLTSWSNSRQLGPSGPHFSKDDVKETTGKLLRALARIHKLEVMGEPSNVSREDVQVRAYWDRLGDLLTVLRRPPRSGFNLDYQMSKERPGSSDRLQDQQASENAWKLIEQYREAVRIAAKCCDAQNDALLNILARAYQKPDFCIRRDSVGPDRDRLFPTTQSWDDDWYVGGKIR